MSDLISRQDAINFRVTNAINEDGTIYVPMREVHNYLERLPTARPTGKWEDIDF